MLSHATNPFTGPMVNRLFLGVLPELFIYAVVLEVKMLLDHGPWVQSGGRDVEEEVERKGWESPNKVGGLV